jgi:hypothetical protein
MKNLILLFAISSCVVSRALAQTSVAVAQERSDYLAWLRTAPNSPLAAVAQQPIGAEVRLGPAETDIPLEGLDEHRVTAKGGSLTLQSGAGVRPLSRGRPVNVGPYIMYVTSSARGPVLTVFGKVSGKLPPGYFPYDSALVFTVALKNPEQRTRVRVLAVDGVEVEATEAGSIFLPIEGGPRLLVRRLPNPGSEESELEIFFRDEGNGHGTYPAGRFVNLIPLPNGDYRLDLNRARNPFCAYNSVYPCPAPWPGNSVPQAIRAGERYEGIGATPALKAGAP